MKMQFHKWPLEGGSKSDFKETCVLRQQHPQPSIERSHYFSGTLTDSKGLFSHYAIYTSHLIRVFSL